MTKEREQQIQQATKDMVSPYKECFVDGVEWADKHPSPNWIEKACTFIDIAIHKLWSTTPDIIIELTQEDFRKYMKENNENVSSTQDKTPPRRELPPHMYK